MPSTIVRTRCQPVGWLNSDSGADEFEASLVPRSCEGELSGLIDYRTEQCKDPNLPALTVIATKAMNKRRYNDWTCILQVGNETMFSAHQESE